ncbi:beta-propeller fold lactonase family protein [Buchnera aphidicola (Ceratoglyphina bambusae)]|uniref:beta-propeller fold lactonase family protein n=1 Tax=Buchnera aphidicola TaxID=9 RepID=UPI0031B852A6
MKKMFNKIIYISIPNEKIIKVLKINNNFIIKVLQKFNTCDNVQPLQIFFKKKILYAGLRPRCKILISKILENGCLKKINEVKLDFPSNHICLDLKNKFLFSSSYHGNCLEVYKIDENGIPIKKYTTFFNIKGCHFSTITLDNNFLLFTALKEDKIYFINLSDLKKKKKIIISYLKLEKNSGPRHLSLHPNKKYFYIINELNSTICTIKISSKKFNKFEIIQKISLVPKKQKKFWASEIQITSCGKYLYASDRIKNIISSFKIDKKKFILKFLKHYYTENQPRSFRIDSSGNFLAVVGEKSNSMSIYKINNLNGSLKKIVKKFFVGNNPIWINFYDL